MNSISLTIAGSWQQPATPGAMALARAEGVPTGFAPDTSGFVGSIPFADVVSPEVALRTLSEA